MIPWAHPTPQPVRRFCRAPDCDRQTDTETDRQTGHATAFVTTGSIYARSNATRPNNNNKILK